MEIDINDFVTFTKLKNGEYKISHDKNNQANIAKFLHKIGYGTTKVNSKNVFFKRENADIIPVYFDNIRRAFYKTIQNYGYKNLPENVSYIDISNWYLTKHPIKKNEIFKHYLNDNLTENEMHLYLLKANHQYNEEYKVQKLLSKLSELNFSVIENHKSSFYTSGIIHYKNIAENQFLLFLQKMNKNLKRFMFECYLAEYNNTKEIALKSPKKYREISCCFDIEKDYAEIEQYLK